MWYLILPPLIFLVGLWLLLFFLSRRIADPAVQERLANDPTARTRGFFSFREEASLRILEKVSQRLRFLSLKLHNTFGEFSQNLKTRRERFTLRRQAEKETLRTPPASEVIRVNGGTGIGAEAGTGETKGKIFFDFRKKSSPSIPTQGTVRESSNSLAATGMSFIRKRRNFLTKPKVLVSEDELIGKIAKNPKDAQAYEALGDYYMQTNDLDDAKACYRQVIKLLPLNREVKDKVRKLERLLTEKRR